MEDTTQKTQPPAASRRGTHETPNCRPAHPEPEALSLLRYKRWADAALLEAVLAAPGLSSAPEGGYAMAIIRHFHTVDDIFRAHLLGVAHAHGSSNPSEPATLTELQPRVRSLDDWYVAYARGLDERALAEALNVRFTDGREQVLTRAQILHYVSLHGAGHRAQVGLLLRLRGAEPPPDRYVDYLRQPADAGSDGAAPDGAAPDGARGR